MILILSTKFDYSTNNVIDWLNYKKVKVIRMNSDDERYTFEYFDSKGIYFKDNLHGETINLLEANACWWRRSGMGYNNFIGTSPLLMEKNGIDISSFTSKNNKFYKKEITRLIEYIYHTTYKKCNINLGKPIFDFNRLVVMDMALDCGLDIPYFEIITNCNQLRKANNQIGQIVSKAISNGLYDDINGYRFYTYTELIEDRLINNDNYVLFPSLITQMVEKKYEIRSFFIDNKFYSMAIFSQTDEQTKIDFRKYSNNRNEPYKLPFDIENKLKSLFKKLDLNTGSIDLIVDKNDNYIFLEINPVGQYGMTSFPCNYNLEETIANYLLYGRIIST